MLLWFFVCTLQENQDTDDHYRELTKYLPQYVGPAAVAAGLPESSIPALLGGVTTGTFSAVPGINAGVLSAIGAPIKQAYAMSFRTVFLCTLPFGAIILVAAILYCPNVEDYLTDEVARKLQGVAVDKGRVVDEKDQIVE